MHAVIPYCEGRNASEGNEFILCHVRSVDHKRDIQDWDYKSCFVEQHVDFYRLFAFLHNFVTAQPQWSFFHKSEINTHKIISLAPAFNKFTARTSPPNFAHSQ